MPVIDGGDVRVWILWEDNGYTNSPNDSTPKVPGANARLDTNEATNNGTRVTLPASRTSVTIRPGTFDGAWALSWRLTNPWMFRAIRGSPSTVDNGDGTYTHTYDGTPDPFRIYEGYEPYSDDDERALIGCVARQMTIGPAVGDDDGTQVTMEGFYAKDGLDSPGTLTTQPTLDQEVLGYEDATLDLDGTPQTIMQEASLRLQWPDLEDIVGWGSRFPIDWKAGMFEPDIDYTKIKVGQEPIKRVYGGSTTSIEEDVDNQQPLAMTLDNGTAAGSGQQIVALNGTGSFPESYGEPGVGNPRSRIDENISELLENVTIDATNETSAAP